MVLLVLLVVLGVVLEVLAMTLVVLEAEAAIDGQLEPFVEAVGDGVQEIPPRLANLCRYI